MAHFAKVLNGIVTQVIVADQEFIDSYVDGNPGRWVQTSYNTHGGVHALGGTPLRKNYAAVGDIYDRSLDAFYMPKPHASWILNTQTCLWYAPTSYPTDGKVYHWNEPTTSWVEVTEQA